mmetsp:Transcript_88478/g.202417  ORF Transcript_88478/g.202417 Transcript_88478/m.202417 type:complete len:93 (-) Transcript_88478:76-354(-)
MHTSRDLLLLWWAWSILLDHGSSVVAPLPRRSICGMLPHELVVPCPRNYSTAGHHKGRAKSVRNSVPLSSRVWSIDCGTSGPKTLQHAPLLE